MNYDFRALSPLDFENLVRDLIQAETGLRFESFGPGPDSGIDFRASRHGLSTIIQAKHYADAGFASLVGAVGREYSNVERLTPLRYILATSVSLTPHRKARLLDELPKRRWTEYDIFGREDLNALLAKHPQVERAHFKLWIASSAILDRVLHAGRYNRTAVEIERIRETLPRFVHNDSVLAAEEILADHRVLIVAGSPGVGKSTLSRVLIWLHLAQDWDVSVIDDIAEAFEIDPRGRPHLIFFDDFLGQIQLSSEHIRGVDQRFAAMLSRLRVHKNLRFILTTRDYILAQGQEHSQRLGEETSGSSKFVLNIETYTRPIRARILFNHIFFSELERSTKLAFLENDLFLKLIDHPNFNPRLIEVITSKTYLEALPEISHSNILEVFDHPDRLWEKPFRSHLSETSRILLFALFFQNRSSLEDLEMRFRHLANELGIPPLSQTAASFQAATRETEGSFISIFEGTAEFSNPGVRDFLLRAVVQYDVIPAVLRAANTEREISSAWEAYRTGPSSRNDTSQMSELFATAMARVDWSDIWEATPIALGLEMFANFKDARFIGYAKNAASQFLKRDLDLAEEADRFIEIMIIFTGIPAGNRSVDNIRGKLSRAIRAALFDCAEYLTFEQLRSMGDALVRGGDGDEDENEAAMQAAIERHVENIYYTLDELRTWDEVYKYRDDLIDLCERFRYPHRAIRHRIDTYEADYPDIIMEDPEYRNTDERGSDVPSIDSEEHIRSIFQPLVDVEE